MDENGGVASRCEPTSLHAVVVELCIVQIEAAWTRQAGRCGRLRGTIGQSRPSRCDRLAMGSSIVTAERVVVLLRPAMTVLKLCVFRRRRNHAGNARAASPNLVGRTGFA